MNILLHLAAIHRGHRLKWRQAVGGRDFTADQMSDDCLNTRKMSRTYAQSIITSPTFLTGQGVLALSLGLAPPVEVTGEGNLLPSLVSSFGVILNFGLMAASLEWIVRHVLFRYGVAAYVVILTFIYTGTSLLALMALHIAVPGDTSLRLVQMTATSAGAFAIIASLTIVHDLAERKPISKKDHGLDHVIAMIPFEKRGRILLAEANDHYAVITTDNGKAMIRLRFADVVDALAGETGVQIHRSTWVHLNAIAGVEKKNGRQFVCTVFGERIQVAKSRHKDLKRFVQGHGFPALETALCRDNAAADDLVGEQFSYQ